MSNPIYHPPLAIEHIVDSTEINIDPQVENQPSNPQTIQTNDSPTDSIDQDPTISKYTMNQFQVHQNFSKQE